MEKAGVSGFNKEKGVTMNNAMFAELRASIQEMDGIVKGQQGEKVMPKVAGVKYPYTKTGVAAAKKAAKKKKKPVKKGY